MKTTPRIAAGIATLITASLLAMAPLDAAARAPTRLSEACPGLDIDAYCFLPPTAATTSETDLAPCVHGSVWACPGPAVGAGDDDVDAATSVTPVQLSFDKAAVDPADPGIWTGTVAGDITGTLETRLTDLRVSGPIWHVRFEWIITAGDRSFVADLRGMLNDDTGDAVMNGTVVDGYLRGASVYEEGQLVDAATLQFQGSIEVVPGTGTE